MASCTHPTSSYTPGFELHGGSHEHAAFSFSSEHCQSRCNCGMHVSGWFTLAFKQRSYCSISAAQRALTSFTMPELRARIARGRQVSA